MYQALGQAALNAKGWPMIVEWAEVSNIIWDANVKAFLGQMSPKAALDEAAGKIDKLREM
jgi:ABC-type glycerol-3-phosphate transport system substrate-binding protein